jgi:hypothetical protein
MTKNLVALKPHDGEKGGLIMSFGRVQTVQLRILTLYINHNIVVNRQQFLRSTTGIALKTIVTSCTSCRDEVFT